MAGTLRIIYTGVDTGGVRICYRKTTDPAGVYTCLDDTTVPAVPTCVGAGCTFDIVVPIIDDSCDVVNYEGYVQSLCQPFGSGIGEILFAAIYIPLEDCYSALIECTEADVASILLTDPGAGYDVPPAAAPAVTFSSGIATADAYVADDGVETVNNIVDPTGHVGPTTYVGVALTGTTGAGDWANTFLDVTVDAGGNVTAVTVTDTPDLHTNIGSGHVIGDTFTLAGGGGLVAGITVDVLTLYDTGEVLEVLLTLTDTYTAIPTVIIDPPPGPTPKIATADVLMDPCAGFKKVQCDTFNSTPTISLELGQQLVVCGVKATWLPGFTEITAISEYSQIHDGCCYLGYTYTFTANDTSAPVLTYLDHVTGQWATQTLLNGVPFINCITAGAYYLTPYDADVTIAVGPECP